MEKMKNTIVLLCLLFGSSIHFAQSTSNEVPKEIKQKIEILRNAGLGLTDVQLSRITYVLIGEEKNITKNIQTLEGNKGLQQSRMKELQAQKIMNIKGTMNQTQIEKFDLLKLSEKI